MVGASLGPARLWFTVGFGIINEVYFPRIDTPQIRDLGFIVARDGAWFEVKRVRRYTLTLPAPGVPLPLIVHEGEGYRLELEALPDPQRDVLLLRYRLQGEGCRLYALLAPHLNGTGWHNSARAGGMLTARNGDADLCLAADGGFARSSAGYVGHSDGWQDFARNGAMTWTHAAADDGNVALMGELARAEGVLALAFDPVRHDRLAAAISHGPYLASLAAFAAAADVAQSDELAWRLAAGGFRSTVRLAGSDPTMMADILLSNRAAVLAQIQQLQSHLAHVAALLTAGDAAALRELAASTRAARSLFLDAYGLTSPAVAGYNPCRSIPAPFRRPLFTVHCSPFTAHCPPWTSPLSSASSAASRSTRGRSSTWSRSRAARPDMAAWLHRCTPTCRPACAARASSACSPTRPRPSTQRWLAAMW